MALTTQEFPVNRHVQVDAWKLGLNHFDIFLHGPGIEYDNFVVGSKPVIREQLLDRSQTTG